MLGGAVPVRVKKGGNLMKKRLKFLSLALIIALAVLALSGCELSDLFSGGGSGGGGGEPIEDIPAVYTPTADEATGYPSGYTYYTSEALKLATEVHGNYSIGRAFTLDSENEKIRVYKSLYLYEEDYLQVLHYKDTSGFADGVYGILSDASDSELATVEYTDGGNAYQITVIKDGIYDLRLNTEDFSIDMVRLGDIETPVYERAQSCEMNIHTSSSHTYTEMTYLAETDEYYIEADIPRGASVSFVSASHNSHYKLTTDGALSDTLIYLNNTDTDNIRMNVGGRYKIYFGKGSYHVRAELQNAEEAEYFCQVGFGENVLLTPADKSYIFVYSFSAQGTPTDPYVDIPSFYPELGMKYKLTVIDEDGLVSGGSYITEAGNYNLTVNLKDFTLTVKRVDM